MLTDTETISFLPMLDELAERNRNKCRKELCKTWQCAVKMVLWAISSTMCLLSLRPLGLKFSICMDNNENIRIAEAWFRTNGEYQLTEEQYKRKRRGEPIWQKDKQIAPYNVSKGEWV